MDKGQAAEQTAVIETIEGGPPSERERLRRLATAPVHLVDDGGGREPRDAEALWKALVEGTWSLFDCFHDGERLCFVARRNSPERQSTSALSTAEREVTLHVLAGCANKVIAGAMELAESTVATHLTAAMRKLGVSTRTELVALLGALAPEELGRSRQESREAGAELVVDLGDEAPHKFDLTAQPSRIGRLERIERFGNR